MKNTEIVCINAFLNIAVQKFEGGSLDIKQCHNCKPCMLGILCQQ